MAVQKQNLTNTMPSARIRIPFNPQNLVSNNNQFEFLDQPAMSLSDMVFKFLEDGDWSPESSSSEECHENKTMDLEDEEKENDDIVEGDKSFWEKQHQLLHVNITSLHSIVSYVFIWQNDQPRITFVLCCGVVYRLPCAGLAPWNQGLEVSPKKR
ncbi:unnamed protein product [Dovyalis caffra]|uniref:Uncharacterized protein n=1 Tax=Dovyalis caffra TaxID=77055 RepID=A0AAV1SGR5_9ROSI|nr:unnamed protein product [Dovyalis caffra]